MAIEDWMPNLAERMATIPDLTDAAGVRTLQVFFPDPTDTDAALPGELLTFPALIIMPVRGKQVYSQGGPNIAVHRVQMTLYVNDQILIEGYAIAIPYIKLVRNKLAASLHLGLPNQVDHVLPDTSASDFYEGPGGIDYGSQKSLLGVKFNIEVKEHEAITVSA